MQPQIILGSNRIGVKYALAVEETHLERVRTWLREAVEMKASVSSTH